jgi:hypothetical protein
MHHQADSSEWPAGRDRQLFDTVIAGTLRRLADRLERQLADLPVDNLVDDEAENFETIDETADEWQVEDLSGDDEPVNREQLSAELTEVCHYAD